MNHTQTLLGLLLKGGWLMLPLGLLSLLSIYIIVERLLTYHKYLHGINRSLEELTAPLSQGDLTEARRLCAPQANLIQQVINKGLQQIALTNIAPMLEAEANRAVSFLEEKLSLLATIAGAAPMIGFLGTVTGMIQTFMVLSAQQGEAALFSNGIYEAMITTAVGLIVGITAYIGYNYCTMQVNKTAQNLTYLINLCLIHRK